jgi:hypothetical protein
MNEKIRKRVIIVLIGLIIFISGMKTGISWRDKGWERAINSIKVEK